MPKLNFRPDFRISRHSFDVISKGSPAVNVPRRRFVREKPVLGSHKITVEVGPIVKELSWLCNSSPKNRRDNSFLNQVLSTAPWPDQGHELPRSALLAPVNLQQTFQSALHPAVEVF